MSKRDAMQMLQDALFQLESGRFASAAGLMLEAHKILAMDPSTDSAVLQELRSRISMVLARAEIAAPKDLCEEEFEVVEQQQPEVAVFVSPMSLWLEAHPPPPPRRQELQEEEEDGFCIVNDSADWVLLDDNDNTGKRAALVPSACLECGSDDVTQRCRHCVGRYCAVHVLLMEDGLCTTCALHEHQAPGSRRSHEEKFSFCRRHFIEHQRTSVERLRPRVEKVIASAAEMSSARRLLDLFALRRHRVLCCVCGTNSVSSVACALCDGACCSNCLRLDTKVASIVVDRACVNCFVVVTRERRVKQRIRLVAQSPREDVRFYESMFRPVVLSIRSRMEMLHQAQQLWERSDGAMHYRQSCMELCSALDESFVQLAKCAQHLKAQNSSRLLLALSAFTAEFYQDHVATLRSLQTRLKEK